MVQAIKILNILTMVFTFYLIFPLIIGINANKALDNASSKKDLGSYPILVLLFVNLISGILMLSLSDADFAK